MADLSTHYKEVSPEQTVQNIKDFFSDNNLTLVETDCGESEAGSWFCHVDVYKGQVKLGGTNGKGVSKAYALASGYAELYERFCNKIFFLGNYYWMRDYMKTNKERFNYYFSPNEKILTYDEEINNSHRIRQCVNSYAQGNKEIEKAFIHGITNDIYVGVPFYNIGNKEDKLYMDPRMVLRVSRSNGMAAGNTLTEALNQALSELVEREVSDRFFTEMFNFTSTFHALKLENITNPTLQKYIHTIKEKGYDLYFFDMSYNYGYPVIMSLLLDRKTSILNINFGAFPVFEIAAERTITELYQGIRTYKINNNWIFPRIPFKTMSQVELLNTYSNSISGEIFPSEFFKHITYEDSYNTEVFLDQKVSNENIYQYYIDLQEKIPGCTFYYTDNSLSDKLYAVYTFIENTDEYVPMNISKAEVFTWTPETIALTLQHVKLYEQFAESIYKDPTTSSLLLMKFLNLYFNENVKIGFLNSIYLWYTCFVEDHKIDISLLTQFLTPEAGIDYTNGIFNTEIGPSYHKYLQLLTYVRTGAYSIEELLYIFNTLLDYNITIEDINKIQTTPYLLQKVYIEPLKAFVHSQDYQDIIDVYVNNNRT